MMTSASLRLGAAMVLVAALTGCAKQQSLYSWNSYPDQVYTYLKQEASPEQQVLDMEAAIQKAHAAQRALPPGYYAHLGLMYMNSGRTDQAVQAWEQEKQLFPESIAYIDYLLANLKKNHN